MNEIKTIDFSGLKDFEACPQRYKWSRLEKRKPAVPENSYYAISGIVKQKLFELCYNEMWYLKGKECVPYMESQAARVLDETLKWARVDWSAQIAKLNKAQMLEEIKSGMAKGIKMIKAHRLLSKESKSEVRLVAKIENWVELVGKVDFIIKHLDTKESYIIDGKDTAAADRMKTAVDPRQLYVYSFLHQRNYGEFPTKVGFMYWRHDTVDYYDPVGKVDETYDWIKKSYWEMKKSKFEPKPSSENCFFCKYKHECDAFKSLKKKYDDGSGVEEGEISF